MLRSWQFAILISVIACGSIAAAREWVDATGKFKVEAEFVALRGGKVILEKPDGSVLSIPLDRLSASDQEHAKKLGQPTAAKPAGAPEREAGNLKQNVSASELPARVRATLQAACHRCHGEDGASEGGFNFVVNLPKLAKTFAQGGNASESVLLHRMSAKDDSVMPPVGEMPRPTANEIATVRAWIEAGSPAGTSEHQRDFITHEQVVKFILGDVQSKGDRNRRFYRYFTLTHLYNAGVSDDELQTFRNAFNKLINSLSWNTSVVEPPAIDPAKTIYGFDIRELNWTTDNWAKVQQANPYFVLPEIPESRTCCEETQTEMPYARIDWFVFAASKPPLYHHLLNVPETAKELEALLRVNAEANVEQEQAIRAGFNRSGVSQHNRLIEWHKSPYGSYWKSYDFGGSTGRQNLFQYPLGPGANADTFRHDGGELIFTLPNGLQGYLLVDGDGNRIDTGPTSIVSDPKRPDKLVTNGVSCMSCHYLGVIPKSDEVGVAVRANARAFENSADILALYRESKELEQLFSADAKRFAEALQRIGITSLSRSGEPISAMASRFEQEVDLQMAACEFGLSPRDFLRRLDGARSTARMLSPLRVPGGTIKRDVMKDIFAEACVDLGISHRAAAARAPSTEVARNPAEARRNDSPARPERAGTAPSGASELARFGDLSWGLNSLAYAPGGAFLAGGKMDQAILLFDVKQNSRAGEMQKLELLQSVEACAFTPGGGKLLAGGRSGQILVFDVTEGGDLKQSGQFAGHSRSVSTISISPDGNFALSGGDEKNVRYWEIATGQELASFSEFEGPIKACAIARGGRSAYATDGSSFLEIDLGKKEIRRQRRLNSSWAAGQAAAFSPDSRFVAVGDSYAVRVWNVESQAQLPPLPAGEILWSLAFTPDGSLLLGGGNAKVHIWDVKRKQRTHVQALVGNGYVKTLAVASDGKSFAAYPGSAGQELQLFRLGNSR